MTAPDPGLTDLIAAHRYIFTVTGRPNGCQCGRNVAPRYHPAHVAEMLTATHAITPKLVAKPGIPCGDWADGHSYRKCTRPKGHEGHHG